MEPKINNKKAMNRTKADKRSFLIHLRLAETSNTDTIIAAIE